MNAVNKNVIITGSSSGFGLKAAKAFADKGYQVFATMRKPNGKNVAVKDELQAYSQNIHIVDMDVTSDESVKTSMADVLTQAGTLHGADLFFLIKRDATPN